MRVLQEHPERLEHAPDDVRRARIAQRVHVGERASSLRKTLSFPLSKAAQPPSSFCMLTIQAAARLHHVAAGRRRILL